MKFLNFIFIFICLIILVAVLFIKLNTTAAAEFTDNVLRPLLGDTLVINLEKIYFNANDTVSHFTANQNTISGPQFLEPSTAENLTGSHLNLQPLSINHRFKPLSGEGLWHNKPLTLFPNQEVLAYTFTRPDPDRPYAIVTVVQADMSVMRLGAVAGTKQPAGLIGRPGPGKVPTDIVSNHQLIAAFEGGFQYRDGQYGMVVGNTTYLPLKPDLGTLIGYQDGTLNIIDYVGQDLGHNIAFIRQNCPILINNGDISILNPRNKALWGRTPTASIFTWRSGLGLTKEGNLLYAVGNNLDPLSLSNALKAAGAVSAIQLDINPNWVRFNIFNPSGPGSYSTTTLTRDLKDGSQQFLNGYEKDFFYLFKK